MSHGGIDVEGRFRLQADWDPAGDQPEAIESLVRGFREGLPGRPFWG